MAKDKVKREPRKPKKKEQKAPATATTPPIIRPAADQ